MSATVRDRENQIIDAVLGGELSQLVDALAQGCDPHVVIQTTRGTSSCLLALAASRNHASLLPHLVEVGLALEGVDSTGRTPLMDAAIYGQTRAVKMLLKLGADPLRTDIKLGRTALHFAALWGHEETVPVLSSVTPKTALDHDGRTPMHYASEHGHVGVLKQMHNLGWSYHSEDKNGRTLLHWAVFGGHLDAVQFLVLDVRLDPLKTDNEGNSPLTWSAMFGRHGLENWLLKESGIISLNMSQTLQLMRLRIQFNRETYENIELDITRANVANFHLIPESRDGHLTDQHGRTPLHRAAEHGDLTVVEKLLDQGLDANVVTFSGLTPADLAYQSGHTLIGQVLEREQCQQVKGSSEELYGALLLAISKSDDVAEVSRLLRAGASMEPVGALPQSALQLAISVDRQRIVNLLLARGAALTSTLNGLNLLQQAWRSPDVTPGILAALTMAYSRCLHAELIRLEHCGPEMLDSIVSILSCLEGETPWKARWPGSKTPAHAHLTHFMAEAARANCPLTATFLQQAGAWSFFSGPQVASPLHTALEAGHWSMVDVLVKDLGGCPYVPDSNGCLPIHMMPLDRRQQLEQRIYEHERRKLENMEIREKAASDKRDVRRVLRLQSVLFTRYTQDRKRKRPPDAGTVGLLLGSRYGLLQLVYLLLKVGRMPVDTVLDATSTTTALHQAAAYGKSSCLALLLSAGADPLRLDRYDQTPLLLAAMFGHKNTFHLLSQYCIIDPPCREVKKALMTKKSYTTYLRQYNKIGRRGREALTPLDHHSATRVTCKILKSIQPQDLLRETERLTVNFLEGEAAVVKRVILREVNTIMNRVAVSHNIYRGVLRLVGSSHDGSKLYAPDEFDINVVIQSSNVNVTVEEDKEETKKYGETKLKISVSSDDPHLHGNHLMYDLYEAVQQCLTAHPLDDERLSLVPPGLTRTQVGVALSMAWQGTEYPLLLIGVDLVPVLEVPWHERIKRPPLTPDKVTTMHISNTADGAWRCSFALTEAEVLGHLTSEERLLQLMGKILLSGLKADPWMPRERKAFCTWWSGRLWQIPVPNGFCFKNALLRWIEAKRATKMEYYKEDAIKQLATVFRKMCLQSIESSKELLPRNTSAYFGGECEGHKQGNGAPLIVDCLNKLHRRWLWKRKRDAVEREKGNENVRKVKKMVNVLSQTFGEILALQATLEFLFIVLDAYYL